MTGRRESRDDKDMAEPMAHVCILYAIDDQAFALKLATVLAEMGHAVSRREVEAENCALIDGAPGEPDAMMVIWSDASITSRIVIAQAREALARRTLTPVAIGKIEPPASFQHLWPIDLSGWTGDLDDPRWRFVTDEINLSIRRAELERHGPPVEDAPAPAGRPRISSRAVLFGGGVALAATAASLIAVAPLLFGGSKREAPRVVFSEELGPGGPETVAAPQLADARAGEGEAAAQDAPFVDVYAEAGEAGGEGSVERDADVGAESGGDNMSDGAEAVEVPSPDEIFAPDEPDARSPELAVPAPEDVVAVDRRASAGDATQAAAAEIAREAATEPAEAGAHAQADVATGPSLKPIRVADAGPGDGAIDDPDVPAGGATDAEGGEPAPRTGDGAGSGAGGAPGADEIREAGVPAAAVAPAAKDAEGLDRLIVENTVLVSGEEANFGGYFRDCLVCPDMAELSGGSYLAGTPARERTRSDDERPAREARIDHRFAIGAREVTFAQWDACVAEGGCNGYQPSDYGWGRKNRPVINISFEDAQAYVAWLSGKTGRAYRLPSEAEWEYAARAGARTPFSFGQKLSPKLANYNGNYAYNGPVGVNRAKTTPVASFAPNPFGLFDMHGNVWEWTSDCWEEDCARRVLKGGAWNTGGWRLRAGHRIAGAAARRDFDNGFRVARDLD